MADVVEQWERAAAGWRKWRSIFEQRTDAERYIEAAGIKSGWRVLDVGAGAGDETIPLARAVGSEGEVVAADIAEPMLEILEERAEAEGFENIETIVCDAASLAVDGPPFDAAVCGFALMIPPEPEKVAARTRDHLKPGAPFVASVWATPDKVPLMSTVAMVGATEFGVGPPETDGPGLFALSDPDRLAGVLESAGFESVGVEPLPMPLRYPTADDYATMVRETAVLLSDHVREQMPDREDEFWAAVARVAAERAGPDGTVTLENEGLMAVGRNPV